MKKKEIERQVSELIKKGYIRPSQSQFCSPINLIKKKDIGWRFCIDYRRLNKITVKNKFPLPRSDDTLDSLANMKVISKIDLHSGYWQVSVKEKDRYKTAFKTSDGLWEWNVMPFGLSNGPATFQRLIYNLLYKGNLRYCLVYLDDIVVFSENYKDHIKKLKCILLELNKYKLIINYEKS